METYRGTILTLKDALIVIESTRIKTLQPISMRLTSAQKTNLIKPGNVFVYDSQNSNIKRWTDGRLWSSSKLSKLFLCYYELNPSTKAVMVDGLIKLTFSILLSSTGNYFHLIYYTSHTSNKLIKKYKKSIKGGDKLNDNEMKLVRDMIAKRPVCWGSGVSFGNDYPQHLVLEIDEFDCLNALNFDKFSGIQLANPITSRSKSVSSIYDNPQPLPKSNSISGPLTKNDRYDQNYKLHPNISNQSDISTPQPMHNSGSSPPITLPNINEMTASKSNDFFINILNRSFK